MTDDKPLADVRVARSRLRAIEQERAAILAAFPDLRVSNTWTPRVGRSVSRTAAQAPIGAAGWLRVPPRSRQAID